MKLIVISSSTPVANEHAIINSMFKEGLEFFHLNKPALSKTELENYIQKIDSKYHNRIAIHSDFQKFHSLEELKNYHPSKAGQIAFLSPIFDSISKQGYKSTFSDRMHKFIQLKPELITAIKGKKIIALGGIDEDKIELLRKVGFAGVGILGAIWHSKNPLNKFLKMRDICDSKAFLRRELFLEGSKDLSHPTTRKDLSHE